MKKHKIKVILLVAGEGKRLRPYTKNCPKCMVEIDGISLIDRQIAVLQSEGINNIVMIGGYKVEMLESYGTKLMFNPRYYETNMVWTLFCAEDELEGDVIVSYGDIVYSKEILQALLQNTEDIAVTIDKNWERYWRSRNENPLDDAETLKLRENGTISEIGRKPKSLNNIEGQYMGLIKFSDKGIKQLKQAFYNIQKKGTLTGKSIENLYMTDLLQELIELGFPVHAVPIFDKWIEVDTVDDLHSQVTMDRVKYIEKNL